MGSCEKGDESAQHLTVVVTGFGPFGVHQVNASWSAVQELGRLGVPGDVDLIIQEIPVEYEAVTTTVPELWGKHKPQLMVHVGVSGIATELTLEQQAHNDGYCKEDVRQCRPANTCCVEGSENSITATIDMQQVCDHINKTGCGVKAVTSHDPGRYLCDFCFYTSLNIDRGRSAFIHVPPLGKPYSARQLAQGIQEAIVAMLQQIS